MSSTMSHWICRMRQLRATQYGSLQIVQRTEKHENGFQVIDSVVYRSVYELVAANSSVQTDNKIRKSETNARTLTTEYPHELITP